MTELVRCPKCHARTWEDIHALEKNIQTRFRCERCGHTISLGKCSKCDGKSWTRLRDDFEKESKKPVVRFKCEKCARVIGIVLF